MTVPSFSSSSPGSTMSALVVSDGITSTNHNFKRIQIVPSSTDFLDIVLSKTQRKTPTVVHKGYQISRIRNFYMRKVKFTQSSFDEKLQQIVVDFPKIEEVHPFYADLMNVLYDKDHYKLALGQLSTAKHLIGQIGKEYLKLLKFGDSLYRCKQLKRAALGRMATVMKRQKDALSYLEQVRQHLARLPSIDPATRTLLVCGYPNVGKSSFMNKVSRACVDVQPYAFTTKSLFVGHFDYEYLRWQVIDTPGILDHPLDQRNTIEMQSITALAHIRSCILFFIDVSETCGYSLSDQLSLFNSLKPLFKNKPVVLVANKCDLMKISELSSASISMIHESLDSMNAVLLESSTMTEEGVMNVRNTSCELLLSQRVEQKKQKTNILSRLHVAMPQVRDSISRLPIIPLAFTSDCMDSQTEPIPLLKDTENMNGGPGVFSYPHSFHHFLSDWKTKAIPEIMDGKNISDFIDPEIEQRLATLEEEEEEMETYAEKTLTERGTNRSTVLAIRKNNKQNLAKRMIARLDSRSRRPGSNKVSFTSALLKSGTKLKRSMSENSGINSSYNETKIHSATGKVTERSRSSSRFAEHPLSERSRSRVHSRMMKGLARTDEKTRSTGLNALAQRDRNRKGYAGDADRHATASIPKHLYSGKRKNGTHDRR